MDLYLLFIYIKLIIVNRNIDLIYIYNIDDRVYQIIVYLNINSDVRVAAQVSAN